MTTFPCTLEQFRSLASEFLKALPNLRDQDQIANGVKALGVAFIGLQGSPADIALAESLVDYTVGKAVDREAALLVQRRRVLSSNGFFVATLDGQVIERHGAHLPPVSRFVFADDRTSDVDILSVGYYTTSGYYEPPAVRTPASNGN